MNNYMSRVELDEISEGLIKVYAQKHSNKVNQYIDIEHFITQFLSLTIEYASFAEDDSSKMGFLADGETPLLIHKNGEIVPFVFPKDTIVLDKFLLSEKEKGRRRFTLAHEASHYILSRMYAMPCVGRFHAEYDKERSYSKEELAQMFAAAEWQADAMGASLLKSRNECIVESIIRMVKMLGMAVLAEGVEKAEQADVLRSLGCAYIQGYLYSEPLPYDEFVEYVRTATSERINRDATESREEIDENYIQTQRMFHGIIAGTNDVVIVSDNNTNELLYANHAAEQYFGKRFDPINPTTCMEYCNHSELCNNCPAKAMKTNEIREHFTVENGKHLKITFNQMDWNGHDAFVYYQTDITDQMREYEFSDALIHNMPGATFAFELSNEGKPQVRYISANATRMFEAAGVKDRTPVYDDFINILHPDDRELVGNSLISLFLEKKPFQETFRILLANGNAMWVETFVNPVADREGSYLFYGLYNDITERKNAQEHMDDVLQSIPAAITIYEITGTGANRVFISDYAQEVLMLKDDNHEKRPVEDLYSRVYEEDRQRVKQTAEKCFKEGEAFSIQFRIVSDAGVLRWVQVDSQPIKGTADESLLFYSIYRDVTELKELLLNPELSTEREVIERTIQFGLQESAKQPSSRLSVEYIVRFVGEVLHGERAYIFEMNPDRTNSNTFEWVAYGITPEKDNLQNLPEELSRPWYEQFEKERLVVIENLEDIKTTAPDLYEALSVQDIHSLIVAPLFGSDGKPMGFFGIDNPPIELISRNSGLIQTIAYYIEAALKRMRLDPSEDFNS